MDESSAGNVAGQWKSRFPVARIKKIMQADEDVGKVAQVTPVAVSKALELFMDRIIKAVSDETRARGARRVTPSHFKQIISTQKEYDFLESLTAGIPLPPSRPATPPPSTTPHHPRRRRKTSPSNSTAVDSATDAPPKRKRRSANKEPAEDVSMKSASPTRDAKQEPDHEASSSGGHRGWFDIVMGSNEQESSEDEGAKRRKKAVKDEDEDYVP